MRSIKKLVFSITILMATAQHGVCQTVPLRGRIISASINSAAPAVMVTTPKTGAFVLTQFCTTYQGGLTGSSVGGIVSFSVPNGSPPCASFNPGYALPPNEQIICQGQCSISGVLER